MKRTKIFLLFALAAVCSCAAGGEKMFAYRSFWPEFEAMKDFADAGVNTVALFPANTCNSLGDPYSKYPPVWQWIDKYDFDSLDKQFDDVLAVNPNAEFLCLIDLNSPIWLSRRMSCMGYSMEADSFSQLSNAVANPFWREQTTRYLKAFLEHAEKKYGKKIKAYLMLCGTTDEWMDYSRYCAGRSKTSAWNKWRAERGKAPAPVPSLERMDAASFENFLRDPSKESDIIDYVTFSSDIIADAIEGFAKTVRENASKDKQIGMFFGYIAQLTKSRMVSCGHLSYERIFGSPYIDFFISPGSYYDRKMGEGSGFMCPNGTRLASGKGWLHEMDHFTPTSRSPSPFVAGTNAAWETRAEIDAGLKREFSLAMVNRTSLWCFDMWGGFFTPPETMKLIAQSKKLWDKYANIPSNGVAEVALIVDPQSAAYVNDANGKCGKIFVETRSKLNKIGAPFEMYSFNDIGKVDMGRYKVFVFPAMFHLTPERAEILKKYVFKDGKTSVFLDAAGISDGKTLDVSRVEKLTGFPYGAKGVNEKQFDGYKSVYIGDYDALTPKVLRTIAKDAGVKLYVDAETPVFANDRLAAIHVKDGGKMKVSLPKKYSRITEVYTGKVAAENADSFEYEFASPDTALFELEP